MKPQIIPFLVAVLFSSCLWAKESPKTFLVLSPFQVGARYMKQMNNDMVWQTQPTYSLGGRFQRHTIFLDYNHSEDSSGNQTLTFKKERTEMMLSYRYAVYSFNPFLEINLGLGLGFYEDKTRSRLGAQEISEATGAQPSVLGLTGVGGSWKYLYYGLEIQALSGRDFDPQPTLGGLFRLGAQFVIF